MGGALGLTFTPYEADAANQAYVGSLAIGFDAQAVVWFRPMAGVRGAAGVEFLRGPDGSNGHPAKGSYGLASIALALRTPPTSHRPSIGLDFGISTTFESTYSYTYTSGNVIYAYPHTDLPLRAGPFVELSLRKAGFMGWLVSYRHFTSGPDANEGRLKRRIMVSFSVSK